MDLLKPFEPTLEDPWDEAKAAHLARRAGFGATPDEIAHLVELGPAGAVAHFVDFPDRDDVLEERIEREGSGIRYGGSGGGIRREWFLRMVHGAHPLREKLTLLWHDHFATMESKVEHQGMLQQQLQLLRKHAAGDFSELVYGIARDPAMLVLLDNRLSVAGQPNENWARELLELYTVGVDNYTQQDIVELARIFTGWTTPDPKVPRFVFDPEIHDTEDKVLFGERVAGRSGKAGIKEAEEAMARILARPECPQFVAGKLAAWLGSHTPPAEVVEEVAAVLSENDLSIREAVRALLGSTWFFAPENRLSMYKNPVELAAGTLRLLEVQNAHLAGLDELTRNMGMDLYEPPSVAGWEHGEGWVDSGAVVMRFNFALTISELPHSSRTVIGRPAIDLEHLAGEGNETDQLVDGLAWRLLQRPFDPRRRAALADHLRTIDDRRDRTRTALHLLLTTPEYALA